MILNLSKRKTKATETNQDCDFLLIFMTLSSEFSSDILRLERKGEYFLIAAAFDEAQGNHLYFWASFWPILCLLHF